ncbi:G-protein coupled receptor Mth-like [Ischnura elegans]|uniref:G-protein coupled receptor Mth-like n=1 Tax=Ischnura elegans TaxID=197161 RepID=UPI001ED8A2E1|nr:G-protein coupled receptor Mth-like [Ischnura elegans]XP_046389826.1 G-protein coupled receptor Mth-like [Ischnura elegans]
MGESRLKILAKLSIVFLWVSSIHAACDVELSVEFETATIFENGTAWDGTNLYPNGTYWTDFEDGSVNATNVTRGCPCTLEKPCLRKCCPYNQQMVDLECAEDTNGEYEGQWFRPEVSDDGNVTREVEDAGHFHVIVSRPCSGYSMHPDVESRSAFYIRDSDGKLCLLGEEDRNKTCLDTKDFCLDYVPDSGVYLPFVCPESEVDSVEVKKEEFITLYEPIFDYAFTAAISVSTIFLAVTFLVYAFIPELRTLPGKCHMCHVFSVFAYNAVHLVFSVMNTVLIRHPWITCYIIDIPNYFFYFTSFSWLNVICYDICMAFIELRPIASPIRQHEFKRFVFYSVYAWSAPLIVFSACVLLEHLTLTEANPFLRLGNLCSEPTISYSWLYHIAPMSFLMVCNVILFVITAVNLYRAKRSTAVLAESGNRRSQDENRRQRFKMYLKLLIVMGLNWSLEPVYWSLHSWVSNGFTPQLWRVLHIMVIIIYLQGFFIFLIFVYNDRVIKLIKIRLVRLKRSKRAMEFWSNLNCCIGNESSNNSSQSNVVMRW